ncbi:MAG: hypothetical protein HQK54_11015 [Oligoflexales bacterium]|nr:hypothetical protein [Oligoflexales bacterium]
MDRLILKANRMMSWLSGAIILFMIIIFVFGIYIPKKEPLRIKHIEDPTGEMRFSDIYSIPEKKWISSAKPETKLGMSDSTFWFRADIRNRSSRPESKIIEIPYPVLDEVDFYHVSNDRLLAGFPTGDRYPFSHRPNNRRLFTFPLELQARSVSMVFFRIKTSSDMNVPIFLMSRKSYDSLEEIRIIAIGSFIGIFFAMSIYNLFLYYYTRDRLYCHYIYFVITTFMAHMALVGIGHKYMWPSSPYLEERVLLWLLPFMVVTGGFFIMGFLKARIHAPKSYYLGMVLICFGIFLTFLSTFMPLNIILQVNLGYLMVSFMILAYALRLLPLIQLSSLYFIVAWLSVAISGIVVVFEHWGWIPSNLVTQNATFFSLTFETVLFSMALSDRINRMIEERDIIRDTITGKAPKQALNLVWQESAFRQSGSEERDLTMMFIDIVNFSTSSNMLPGNRTFLALRECLNNIGLIIREYGGVVDRSRGDGLFCFFGHEPAYAYRKKHTLQAFEAAVRIQRESVLAINEGKMEAIFPLRIGINTDKVHVGNLGGERQADFAIIGTGVNMADRLETACYPFKIMLSKNTLKSLDLQNYDRKKLSRIIVKTRYMDKAMTAYEYNEFADRPEIISAAQRRHWEFIGNRSMEKRGGHLGMERLVLDSEYGKFMVNDISVSGIGVTGEIFLGRTMEFEVTLDSLEGKISSLLKEQSLESFTVEVRWGELCGNGFRHGLKICGLNKLQMMFIHEKVMEYLNNEPFGRTEGSRQAS